MLVMWQASPAQSTLRIGQWRSYLPFNSGRMVVQSENRVYYATQWAIIYFDKDNRTFRRFTKVEGLSFTGIQAIAYNRERDILQVAYINGMIDLFTPEGVEPIFDIANFQGLIDPQVYQILNDGADVAYIAGNYGLSKFDLQSNTFVYTTFTGVAVRSMALFGGYLYAATEEGIYRIAEDDSFPADFGRWEWLGQDLGFPADYGSQILQVYNDALYLEMGGELWRFDGQLPEPVHAEPGYSLNFLSADGARLLSGWTCNSPNCQGRVMAFDTDGFPEELPSSCIDRPLHAIEDQNGNVWFADLFQSYRVLNNGSQTCERIEVNSPRTHNISRLHLSGNELWIATGGLADNFNYLFQPDGFLSFRNSFWDSYNLFNRPALDGLYDFIDVAVHPVTGHVYASSFLDGLVYFDREEFRVYNDTNSTLNNAVGDASRTRVGGVAFDAEGNTWIANHAATEPISVWKTDGSWQSYRPTCNANQLYRPTIDNNGVLWFIITSPEAGILLFDPGNLDDPSDDRCRIISSGNSNLPSNLVNCITRDRNGDIWVGTDKGVVIFECGQNVFNAEICQGSLRRVEQDEFGAYLFETENVRAIAADGANRKWFGTTNGLFVQSPTGEFPVAFFNESNSPLIDNNVSSLAIHPETGEVYIGTNKGLMKLRAEATEGGIVNTREPLVFPNPVRPEYQGPIAIKGLARDADVKITDINGQLVYQTRALGGQAIWDGLDYNGRRPNTGVYLVFSTSTQRPDIPDAVVAKIVFIQ
jgi:ligand-binding sensor domain-containing protein